MTWRWKHVNLFDDSLSIRCCNRHSLLLLLLHPPEVYRDTYKVDVKVCRMSVHIKGLPCSFTGRPFPFAESPTKTETELNSTCRHGVPPSSDGWYNHASQGNMKALPPSLSPCPVICTHDMCSGLMGDVNGACEAWIYHVADIWPFNVKGVTLINILNWSIGSLADFDGVGGWVWYVNKHLNEVIGVSEWEWLLMAWRSRNDEINVHIRLMCNYYYNM